MTTPESPKGLAGLTAVWQNVWPAILATVPAGQRLIALVVLVGGIALAILSWQVSPLAGEAVRWIFATVFLWIASSCVIAVWRTFRPGGCPAGKNNYLMTQLLLCERGKLKYTKPGQLSRLVDVEPQLVEDVLNELTNCKR